MSKYTFLLPAYKARYLQQMLSSIQQQTYPDFEVIISDDCSPEDIYSICKPYLDDSRFSYRRNEKNMGGDNLVAHWNLLVDMCRTDYLIMASDDDIYDVSFLESIDQMTLQYPSLDLYRARVERIDSEGERMIVEGCFDEQVDQLRFVYQCYRNDVIPCVSNYCYRTSVLKQMNGFVEFPLAWFSDDATNILMSKNGCGNTAKVLFQFRWSDINITFAKPTRSQACKKLDATILYDKWFKEQMTKLSGGDPVCSEPLLQMKILQFHSQKIMEMCAPYTNVCSLPQFFRYCKKLRGECGYDIKPLFFIYIRHLLKGKKN